MKSAILKRSMYYTYVIYKYGSELEYKNGARFIKKLRKSVDVINSGAVKDSDIKIFTDNADSDNWQKLSLKSGDFFIFTRELPNVKEKEQEKLMRVDTLASVLKAKAGLDVEAKQTIDMTSKKKTNLSTHPKTGQPIVLWTEDELGQLWSGPAEEVAKKLGRTVGAIKWQRRTFLNKNQNFVPPPEAQYTAKQRPPMKRRSWSDSDLAKLWIANGAKVAKMLKRTEAAVYNRRLIFIRENPEFNPPKVAKWTGKSGPSESHEVRREKPAPAKVAPSSGTFKFKVDGKEVELPARPSKMKLGDMEIEF